MLAEIDKRALAALSGGHLATDFAGGALPALLPFFVARFDLSYTLVALVMLASTAASSIIQPLFGLWSDRRGAMWLMPAGVALAGIGMALASAAPSYGLVLCFVVLSGLGTAAFHPEASKFAVYASGRRRASGISLFSVGGNVGYALGPVVATPIVLVLGLEGGLLLALPCLALTAVLLARAPHLRALVPPPRRRGPADAPSQPGALALLVGIIVFRSVAWFGLITFVPLWALELGRSEAYGNNLLSLMLLAGGVGTLLAGPAADRLGRRPVLLASLVAAPPGIVCFIVAGGVVGAIALALVGVCVISTFGVTMVMAQEYLPRHIGMASGLSIGLSIGLGGMGAVALGAVADSFDLRTAFWVCAGAAAAAVPLAIALPRTRPPRRQLAPEPAT